MLLKIEHFFFAVAAKLVCVPEFAAVIGVVPESGTGRFVRSCRRRQRGVRRRG